MTEFSKMNEEGQIISSRMIPQSALLLCPHFILMPEHYRMKDNTCRCDDADHSEMAEWGYRWNGYLWVAPKEDGE